MPSVQEFGSQLVIGITTAQLPDIRSWALTHAELPGDEEETAYIEANAEFHVAIVDRLRPTFVAPTRQDFPQQISA